MIFTQKSFVDDLFIGMQKAELKAIAEDETSKETAIENALKELSAAAKCFEDAGLVSVASKVTGVMVSLVKK
jgi:hypothetical protein